MRYVKTLIGSLAFATLAGCGSGSESTTSSENCFDASQETATSVQWSKLLNTNAAKLSEYNLFADATDPTTNPNARGLEYDLSVPLFTDYASKYRFVFVPPGCTAKFDADEVFDFPVGTVITKTFALPADTGIRGIENENMIETRLMVHRSTGWISMPYVWNANKTDAVLDINGESVITSLEHNGETLDLSYGVPDPQKCKRCHQVNGTMSPIGPKARFLNNDYVYADKTENQLTRWVAEGLLSEVPEDLNSIDSIPDFSDETNIAGIANNDLQTFAKGWLDINCGHCHRPEGDASNTNMHVEWVRDFNKDKTGHGVCQTPVSFGGQAGIEHVIEPGDAAASAMVFRMNTRDGGDRMPPLGRDLIHTEGVELISAWINNMTERCN